MAKGEIKAMMYELYPTAEDMLRDRERYKSWNELAKAINVSPYSLQDHRRRLGVGGVKAQGTKNYSFAIPTEKETIKAIDTLFAGNNTNIVQKYKIVDPEAFYRDMCGYAGLEFVCEEQGKTWRSKRGSFTKRGCWTERGLSHRDIRLRNGQLLKT